MAANPKPFFGCSDNTNLLNRLWCHGVPGTYGGSTQVHLGAGPGTSGDFGPDRRSPEALTGFGDREPTEPWRWAGPEPTVEGLTWGGGFEVVDQLTVADRLIKRRLRALGERGLLAAVAGAVIARAPVGTHESVPPSARRCSRSLHATTTMPSCAPGFPSDTPVRSGSCPTAEQCCSMAGSKQTPPTTSDSPRVSR
ncbi:hypothetical protein [Arthrobacter sp. AQ5-05]|uniref:hypothetical protein n=1 Tax=Arthrobacter sp. AQ5-05 TaxID=2184581 RepID=UPI0026C7E010